MNKSVLVGMDAMPESSKQISSLSIRGAGRIEVPEERQVPRRLKSVVVGWAIVLVVSVLAISVWGSDMDFPTTVSRTEIKTDDGGSVFLEKTIRKITASTIDNAVQWMTVEGNWVFSNLSDVVAVILTNIEKVLNWFPWLAIVAIVGMVSYTVGGWKILTFSLGALLYIGFMGLWDNMIDTIALMVVAVLVAIGIGLPLGVLAARS